MKIRFFARARGRLASRLAPLKSKKKGRAESGARLFLVTRRRPVGGSRPPVGRTRGKPEKSRMRQKAHENRAQIERIIGGDPEFRPLAHRVREKIEGFARQEAPLVVSPLRPRVREKKEGAVEGRGLERREKKPRIVREDANVGQILALDLAEKPNDSSFEDFAADKARFPLALRQGCKMLARAKPDLERNPARRSGEQRSRIEPALDR